MKAPLIPLAPDPFLTLKAQAKMNEERAKISAAQHNAILDQIYWSNAKKLSANIQEDNRYSAAPAAKVESVYDFDWLWNKIDTETVWASLLLLVAVAFALWGPR